MRQETDLDLSLSFSPHQTSNGGTLIMNNTNNKNNKRPLRPTLSLSTGEGDQQQQHHHQQQQQHQQRQAWHRKSAPATSTTVQFVDEKEASKIEEERLKYLDEIKTVLDGESRRLEERIRKANFDANRHRRDRLRSLSHGEVDLLSVCRRSRKRRSSRSQVLSRGHHHSSALEVVKTRGAKNWRSHVRRKILLHQQQQQQEQQQLQQQQEQHECRKASVECQDETDDAVGGECVEQRRVEGVSDEQCLFVGGLMLDPKRLFGKELHPSDCSTSFDVCLQRSYCLLTSLPLFCTL